MRLLPQGIFIFLFFLSACRLSEQSISGTYRPEKNTATRLVIQPDHSFELALLHPGQDSLFFPITNRENFYTKGQWKLKHGRQLVLEPQPGSHADQPGALQDSITRFTSITSFSFWNRYGEPVSIRYLLIPPAKPKPHYGNSLYFFSQDFNPADTLKFFFDGYNPVSYPGTIPAAIGNNIHKLTLVEAYHSQPFTELVLKAGKNKLYYKNRKRRLEKRK